MARVLHELVAADRRDAATLRVTALRRRQRKPGAPVAREPKLDVETRERQIAQHRVNVRELSLLGALKLPPGRGIEEQLVHFDGRPERARGRTHLAELTAVACDLPRVLVAGD